MAGCSTKSGENDNDACLEKHSTTGGDASRCILLSLLGQTFHPAFTHQCFPDEIIRGYSSGLRVRESATTTTAVFLPASDYGDHNEGKTNDGDQEREQRKKESEPTSKRTLKIQVTLAPSCQLCHVKMESSKVASAIAKRRHPRRAATSPEKRKKRDYNDDREDEDGEEENQSVEGSFEDDNKGDHNKDVEDLADDDDDVDDDDEFVESENETNSGNYNNNEQEDAEGATRRRRMPLQEVRDSLEKALPRIINNKQEKNKNNNRTRNSEKDTTEADDNLKSVCALDFFKRPMGTVLLEYTTTTDIKNNKPASPKKRRQQEHTKEDAREDHEEEGTSFCITLADGRHDKTVADYHEQAQKLALFFIETADDVDIKSEDDGFWKVLYLFQKHKHHPSLASSPSRSPRKTVQYYYSFVGYITLFHFHALFRKPRSGTILRICQALVLPPYQRGGHGRRLLHAVFDLCHGVYDNILSKDKHHKDYEPKKNIVEITVEDPAPAFTALRNCVDYECFIEDTQQGMCWFETIHDGVDDPTDPQFFILLSESQATDPATRAKLITRQIQIIYEIHKLDQLRKYISHRVATDSDDEKIELEKRYRRMVKKRLQKFHRAELGGCSKDESKALLAKYFEKCFEQYESILARAQNTSKGKK